MTTTETSPCNRTVNRQVYSRRCAAIGIVALAIGGGFYAFTRSAETVYLFPAFVDSAPGAGFGANLGFLPTFLHVLAFTLLTVAAVKPRSDRACVAIAVGWCVTNLLFETGQHRVVAPAIANVLPDSFASLPLLENLEPFFLNGIFDTADLWAAVLGAAAAIGLILWLRNLENES